MAQLYGGHRSAQRGRGLEFEEVRAYVSGDDARTIDWRVTARRGKPHTKLFREERERPVWIVADLHPGLFFGSKRQFKSAVLLQAAALLAWVAAQGGDRVGAIIADGGSSPHILSPRGREAGVLPILQALVESQPRAPGVKPGNRDGEAGQTVDEIGRAVDWVDTPHAAHVIGAFRPAAPLFIRGHFFADNRAVANRRQAFNQKVLRCQIGFREQRAVILLLLVANA